MNECLFGDCRDTMRDLIAQGVKVQMCVTSPPYFGLRDYGHPGQLGLEQTPAEYVANMVEVFSLVWYLLADDGVLWLNLGDSYAAQRGGTHQPAETLAGGKHGKTADGLTVNRGREAGYNPTRNAGAIGLKHKDLIGIPWRVAFALQEAGWYLRQDIIWHKPNPMPESVTDRCTKAHEYMFLLTKSERYYFDNEAIKEPALTPGKFNGSTCGKTGANGDRNDGGRGGIEGGGTRNRRSVWTIATTPYSGAHFATFPPDLIEPCILAGSRVGDIVLDPFFGSGTTGQVSQALGRQWVGCELNPEYGALQESRTCQQSLVLETA
jgi:DNA modification methylase